MADIPDFTKPHMLRNKKEKALSSPSFTLGLISLLNFLLLLFPWPLSSQMSSFSLSLDLDESEGNQAIYSRAVPSGHVISIQIFGTDIQNAIGVFTRFEYNTTQIVYEGFDTGDVLPNAQALIQQGSGSVEINIASLGGTATSNSGLIGTMRFRTTDALSSTRIRLVKAELSRGGQFETVIPSLSVALQIFMAPSPDFDESGIVDFRDFVVLAGAFGSSQNEDKYEERLDLDSDGTIGFSDFLEFASHFGKAVSSPPQLILPVCDRTAQMRDAIVAATPVSTCGDVTEAHLAAIDSLGVVGTSLSALQTDDFSGLTALTKLNLSNNHFTTIPPQLFNLFNLTYLNLENNELSGEIPEELSNLTNLTELYLNNNASLIGTLPQSLTELTKLEKLLFQDTGLCAPLNAAFQTWLQGITETNGSNCGSPGTYERSLLVALYNATDGDNWTNKTNWLSDNDLSTWHGVSVSNGWVTGLDLRDNNLTGTIPAELGNVTNLRYLNFYANQLSGEIPKELGNLAKLKSLDFWGNALSGEIPEKLGNLTNLTYLRLSENELSGSIPVELGNLTNLEHLKLGNNVLSGAIPEELGDLSNLTYLDLGDNALSGSIPKELGKLSKLEYLELDDSALSGSIPKELGKLSKLEYLELDDSALSGAIPVELGNLTQLNRLELQGNNLSGAIPVELGNLTILEHLYLENNSSLTGALPQSLTGLTKLERFFFQGTGLCAPFNAVFQTWLQSIAETNGSNCARPGTPERSLLVALYNATDGANWTNKTNWLSDNDISSWHGVGISNGWVTSLDLRNNNLTSTIPKELGNLTNLEHLELDDNALSGGIPVELGNLTNLEHLELDGNALSGGIPPQLGNLSNLTFLELSRNELGGSIPVELGNLSNLERLYLDYNALSGGIPVELGNLSNLERLYIRDNDLSGGIPVELSNLSNLERLNLSGNELSGAIPPQLGNLTNFTSLRLGSNALSGAIPVELGNLTQLNRLELQDNNLSGAIPVDLGNLTILEHLYLENNSSLTGVLPQSLTGLTKLERFFFQGTGLCAPLDAAFQAWLQSIAETNGSNCASSSILGQIIDR